MNNYSNINYAPNMQNANFYKQMPYQNQTINNYNQNTQYQQSIQQDNVLKQKLSQQAGDNMNFNKCNYTPKANANNLYDVYGGFIRGNMFPDLYNTYKIKKPFDVEPLNEQAELLTYLDAYSFAAHDLNLYLDNNPNDRQIIELFKSYTNEANKIQKQYEEKYGPLFIDNSITYPWSWNNSPWPWENK
jgi:spore coat protein JB